MSSHPSVCKCHSPSNLFHSFNENSGAFAQTSASDGAVVEDGATELLKEFEADGAVVRTQEGSNEGSSEAHAVLPYREKIMKRLKKVMAGIFHSRSRLSKWDQLHLLCKSNSEA